MIPATFNHSDRVEYRRPVDARSEEPLNVRTGSAHGLAWGASGGRAGLGKCLGPLFEDRDQLLEVSAGSQHIQFPGVSDRVHVNEPRLDGALKLLDRTVGFPMSLVLFLVGRSTSSLIGPCRQPGVP